jgi:hypothetical protein
MNESITNIESSAKATIKPKWMSLPRPIAGALIGIFIFLLITAIFRLTNLFTAFIVLISPGILTGSIIIPGTIAWDTSVIAKLINYAILLGISSIPPGIYCSLIASDKKKIRSKGMILLIIYLVFLLVIGIPISTIFD